MTIQEMVDESYNNAIERGWIDPVPIPEMVALIHSEVSEGLESFRNKEEISWTDKDGKPQGIASEFADILIRIGHYSALLGIDLDYEVKRKHTYNRTRPYKHGGKVI